MCLERGHIFFKEAIIVDEQKKPFVIKNYIPIKTKDKEEWLSDQAMLVYAIVNMHTYGHNGFFTYYITVDDVCRELYGPDGLDSKRRKNIREGFIQLQLCFPNIFDATDLTYKIWKINVDEMDRWDNRYYYCYFYNKDLKTLIQNEKHHLFTICGFYFKYLSTFDYRFGIGRISAKYTANILGMNEDTVKKHIKVLTKKENEVLKEYKCEKKKTKNGTYYQHPDIHYRPMEEDLVYDYLDNSDEAKYFL